MVVEQSSEWLAALVRAHEQGITVVKVDAKHDAHFDRTFFRASSASGHGYYTVQVTCNAGGVFTQCNCPAGQQSHTCKHGALALETLGLVAVPETQPEPTAPQRISGRDALRRLWDLEPGDAAEPWKYGVA